MKNLRKSVSLTLILLLSLSVVLFGCSKGSDVAKTDVGDGKSKASGETVTLTWLVRTDPAMIDWEKDMVKGFEDSHPNIKIQLTQIPQSEIDQRLSTMIASGKMPDVFSTNWSNSGFSTYFKMGALLDLTPYFKADAAALSTINPNIVKLFDVDGKHYGVPMLSLGSFIFYNKDLLDAAKVPYPTTDWDDQSWNYDKVLEIAKQLTHDVGKNNQTFGILNNFSADMQAWAFGGDFFKREAYDTGYIDGQVNVLTDRNKEAIQFNVDLINKYKVSPSQATLEAVSAIGDPFLTGKVAMVMTGGWGFWVYNSAKFHWGVAPVPWYEGRKVPIYADPWNISKTSKHPKESWEFIKYLVDPKAGGKTFMEKTSATPADTTLAEQWYKQMADKMGMTVDQLKQVNEGAIKYGRDHAGSQLLINGSVIGNTISQTATEIWNGKKTVEEGLTDIQKNLESLKIKQ